MSDSIFSSCASISNSDFLVDDKSLILLGDDGQSGLKLQILESCLDNVSEQLPICLKLGLSRNGFVDHRLRKPLWYHILSSRLCRNDSTSEGMPALVRVDSGYSGAEICGDNEQEDTTIVNEKYSELLDGDERQVELDVRRSFGFIEDVNEKEKLREILKSTILKFLRKYPELRYYQGYHDVVSVFVMVFQDGQASDMCTPECSKLERVPSSGRSSKDEGIMTSDIDIEEADMFTTVEIFTLLYLRDFMMDTLDFTIHHLRIISLLVQAECPKFYEEVKLATVNPFFALSAILTLFSHELKPDFDETSPLYQIFDMVISSGSMMLPLVIYASILLELKDDILFKCKTQADLFENNTDLIHGVIQQVLQANRSVEQWNSILDRSRSYLEAQQETSSAFSVEKYDWINPYSVLRTSPANEEYYTRGELRTIISQEVKASHESVLSVTPECNSEEKKSRSWTHYIPFINLAPFWRWPIYVVVFALLFRAYNQNQLSTYGLWAMKYCAGRIGRITSGMSVPRTLNYVGIGDLSWFYNSINPLYEMHSP
ncbi:HDL519Wp [Eremothecium sinecaudum]|uniref:HDL519Wp n=1 Tax=Eremothecium sinecaudum TaxID=45286 RepID=A0A0X8HRQ1_9SACH|nr:HDL519Wp [Eremothecium sinecaudum]AMD20225.1 HDL519Wp [Eremothecium sinecaudum]